MSSKRKRREEDKENSLERRFKRLKRDMEKHEKELRRLREKCKYNLTSVHRLNDRPSDAACNSILTDGSVQVTTGYRSSNDLSSAFIHFYVIHCGQFSARKLNVFVQVGGASHRNILILSFLPRRPKMKGHWAKCSQVLTKHN